MHVPFGGESRYWTSVEPYAEVLAMADVPEGSQLMVEDEYIDFIQFDPRWNSLFIRLREDRAGIEELLEENTEVEGVDENWQWSNIDWATFGRAIGNAILHLGSVQGWLNRDLSREIRDSMSLVQDIPDEWISTNELRQSILYHIDRNRDPFLESERSGWGPSSPLERQGLLVRRNVNAERVRQRIVELHHDITRQGGGGAEDEVRGALHIGCVDWALSQLHEGDIAEFFRIIHGICAIQVSRGILAPHKIGMHLFTILAVCREHRRIEGLCLADLQARIRTTLKDADGEVVFPRIIDALCGHLPDTYPILVRRRIPWNHHIAALNRLNGQDVLPI